MTEAAKPKPDITANQIQIALGQELNKLYENYTFSLVDTLGALASLRLQTEMMLTANFAQSMQKAAG